MEMGKVLLWELLQQRPPPQLDLQPTGDLKTLPVCASASSSTLG
jgi:hypothetical protein